MIGRLEGGGMAFFEWNGLAGRALLLISHWPGHAAHPSAE